MALRGSGCCNNDPGYCAPQEPCVEYTSKIIYDGENIPEAGLRHGDPLNTALANLARYVSRAINSVGPVKMDRFQGTANIRLSETPAEILLVTYCGGVVPKSMWRNEGRTVLFCNDFCRPDEFADVQVVYRMKVDTTYGFRC